VDGIDVQADPAAVRSRIGYLPDFFGVYESLTVSEYLDFYGSCYQIPTSRRGQLIDELLELVALTEHKNNPVKWLSRGMKQRLGLARCLIHDPQILLLDEPASGMDPQSRIELREILQELSRLGKTILISSQILPELALMCTHVGMVLGGEMVAEGTVEEIISALSLHVSLRLRLLDTANRDLAVQLLEQQAEPADRVQSGQKDQAYRQIRTEGESTLLVELAAQAQPAGGGRSLSTSTGAERELAALLAQLVGAGVQVTECTMERRTLEDIFLQVAEQVEPGHLSYGTAR
jgi:ABC-2 type transport system ATP-binding protein